ncbi:hypothetical protein I6E36_02835 [Fusobacterium mortiferum]|uniref:hypothetical protein n=1 Tax=Fusobacterium mortiferum TaxID=850 RepID=UPI001F27BB4F|nr:hypothetical protein [Fusobacterium mortiferum]MCF2627012.1 hypothetical protein [Fusobacterium mortiferum]
MKKMLLGVSILSTLAFGVSNPGGEISSLPATVGVPMEVRVEVLPTSGKLVLVDENNKLIDKLIFDHGKLVKGAAITDSTVEKTVKLKRADGQALGNYKVTFKAKNSSGTPVNMATPLKLQAHGVSSGNAIDSNLKYRENEITLTGTEKEVETKVQSIIEATKLNAAEVGLYIGSGTFEAEVTNS